MTKRGAAVGPTCVAALAALDWALKLTMSSLRVAGAKGEGVPTSQFEKVHVIQLLTTANAPQHMLLIMFHHLQAMANGEEVPISVQRMMVLSVVSCYVFALRALDASVQANGYSVTGGPGKGRLSLAGVLGATGGYLAQIGLAIALVQPLFF